MISILPIVGLIGASAFPCVAPKSASVGYSDGYEYISFTEEELIEIDSSDIFYEDMGNYCEVYIDEIGFVVGEKKAEELNEYSYVAFSLPTAIDEPTSFEIPFTWLDVDSSYKYCIEGSVGTAFAMYFSNDDSIVLGQNQGEIFIGAIGDGVSIVGKLAETLKNGFGAFVLNPDGTLSMPAIFSFSLMGLGIAVGVVKLTFHWLTGRHSM